MTIAVVVMRGADETAELNIDEDGHVFELTASQAEDITSGFLFRCQFDHKLEANSAINTIQVVEHQEPQKVIYLCKIEKAE